MARLLLMDLPAFIDSPLRTAYIEDCDLIYFVRKSIFDKGSIELANCYLKDEKTFSLAYYRFYKKYSGTIPFFAEQVLNPGLAKFYQMNKWVGKVDLDSVPSYFSPLYMERYPDSKRVHSSSELVDDPLTLYLTYLDECGLEDLIPENFFHLTHWNQK